MKHYDFILYDWDGCIAQTLQVHLQAYKETFEEYNIHPSDYEIIHTVFGDWNGPARLGVKDIEVFTQKYVTRVNATFATAPLYPNAFNTIRTLTKAKKQLAVLTTSKHETIDAALLKTQIAQFIQVVLAAEDVQNSKPHPEIIETALRRMDGSKDRAVIIGDSKSDLGAANNAGIDSILFAPKSHEQFYNIRDLIDTFKPTYVVEDHAEIVSIALNIESSKA